MGGGRRPAQVAGLILLAPFLRNGVGEVMRSILQLAFARPWGPFLWRLYAAKLWPGLGDKARERAATTTASLQRPGRWPAFHATLAGADHRVAEPWIGRVPAPVLVVLGDADPDWKEPLKEAAWVASNFRDAETIAVKDAGHAPMFERPEIVNPAIDGFLRKLSGRGAFKPRHA